MQYKVIFRILGLLLMVFSLSMLPPIAVAIGYHEKVWNTFLLSFAVTMGTGLVLWLPFRNYKRELKTRDGFLIASLYWSVLSLFAALPFVFASNPPVGWLDGIFEAVSGLTTTGASILNDLDHLPRSVLYYRQQLCFLGGMGIIVLAVAVLPMLGIGGMQLYRTEIPGPIKDAKLTPRIAETAKMLWFIYISLNMVCILGYWLTGMSWFDAIGEGFSTVSTSGFNMHDNSFAYYNNRAIEIVGIMFMVLGGTNFSLHFLVLRTRSLSSYWQDEEFRAFITILAGISILTFFMLLAHQVYRDQHQAIIHSIFTVVSLITTTGFTAARFDTWPTFVPVLIMLATLIGGCGGSTSGGMKVIRLLMLSKQGVREIKRLLHPNAILTIKFGRQILPEHVLQAMWSFISVFLLLYAVLLLGLMATGLDLRTAFGAGTAALANAGAGIGDIANGFSQLNPYAKGLLIFGMLAGRLEIFTLLVLFTPAFWKH
ncbi:MAG: trk system potassium uptake protein TrkH [Gammaproteobacteria bacterium]|jgi:trk system potassium uptake protein TrkH|nr:trk system potassium uptake protein TrkH [Gammaproteobacteria bacterium]